MQPSLPVPSCIIRDSDQTLVFIWLTELPVVFIWLTEPSIPAGEQSQHSFLVRQITLVCVHIRLFVRQWEELLEAYNCISIYLLLLNALNHFGILQMCSLFPSNNNAIRLRSMLTNLHHQNIFQATNNWLLYIRCVLAVTNWTDFPVLTDTSVSIAMKVVYSF